MSAEYALGFDGRDTLEVPAPPRHWRRRYGTAALLLALPGSLLVVWALTAGVEERTDLLGRFAPPSLRHPLGTDHFGRDVLALVGAGAAPSAGLAAVVVAASAALGTALALLATSGRWRRALLASTGDVLLAVPALVVALVVAAMLGSGTGALLVALCGLGWTPYFRVVLASADTARQQTWVEAAVASGASDFRVLWRHILPNVSGPLVALMTVRFGHAVVSVSSLSYLGVGPRPPSPEWGATLAAAQPYAERAPWAVVGPSLAILLSTATALYAGRRVSGRRRPEALW